MRIAALVGTPVAVALGVGEAIAVGDVVAVGDVIAVGDVVAVGVPSTKIAGRAVATAVGSVWAICVASAVGEAIEVSYTTVGDATGMSTAVGVSSSAIAWAGVTEAPVAAAKSATNSNCHHARRTITRSHHPTGLRRAGRDQSSTPLRGRRTANRSSLTVRPLQAHVKPDDRGSTHVLPIVQ